MVQSSYFRIIFNQPGETQIGLEEVKTRLEGIGYRMVVIIDLYGYEGSYLVLLNTWKPKGKTPIRNGLGVSDVQYTTKKECEKYMSEEHVVHIHYNRCVKDHSKDHLRQSGYFIDPYVVEKLEKYGMSCWKVCPCCNKKYYKTEEEIKETCYQVRELITGLKRKHSEIDSQTEIDELK